jgi:hypothetical protein
MVSMSTTTDLNATGSTAITSWTITSRTDDSVSPICLFQTPKTKHKIKQSELAVQNKLIVAQYRIKAIAIETCLKRVRQKGKGKTGRLNGAPFL